MQRGRTRALDIHEVGVRRLYESLELVPFLLGLEGRVKEIDCERLSRVIEGSLPRQMGIVSSVISTWIDLESYLLTILDDTKELEN